MAEGGDKKAIQLLKLLGEPSRFLATIQIGITLAGFLASAFAAESFADPIVGALKVLNLPIGDNVLKVGTVLVITVILAYFTLVLGELVPKRIAMNKSEEIAFSVVGPLTGLSKIASPFVKLLTVSTNFFVRLFGVDPNSSQDDVTEEEIRMMVDVGEEKGAIHENEKIMINNIFEFNNKTAEDIMTHRMEVVSLPVSARLNDIVSVIEQEKYTRIPVYEENIDNIIGIFHIKDLIPLINNHKSTQDFSLREHIRKPLFVPGPKKIDELFVDLKLGKTHMAVVIDEYGGTAGIVTIEDLVEEIMGNIFDEYDEDEVEIKEIEKNTFEVSGMISLDDMEEPFNIKLPVDDYETLSGFLISILGNIPAQGYAEEITYQHLRMQIVEVTEKRIEKVIVRIEENDQEDEDKI